MTPTEAFLNWFDNQNKEENEAIAFFFLILTPDFDSENNLLSGKKSEKLKAYLTSESNVYTLIGKLLFLRSAFDFLTDVYDDEKKFNDTQNAALKLSQKAEAKGLDASDSRNLYETKPIHFEQRKEYNKNWKNFCENEFTNKAINKYYKDSMKR